MTVVIQVLIGLLTTFIGFVIGLIFQMFRTRIVYWRAHPFWKDFISPGTKLIIGRFKDLDSWEASGLIGVGDVRAMAELQTFLDGLLVKADQAPEILYADQATGEIYGENLICLGGPDANPVTRRILSELHHTFRQENPEQHIISIHDAETGRIYSPAFSIAEGGEYEIDTDFGVVIKSANPFNESSSVLLIYGCFGYGTWAGAKLVRSKQFFAGRSGARASTVECLYETKILQGVPQTPSIISINSPLASNRKH